MTTVVATRNGIWTDSKCNWTVDFETKKSEYIKDSTGAEFLIGICGTVSHSVKAIALLKTCPLFEAYQHVPDGYWDKPDFSLTIVTRDKRIISMDEDMTPIVVLDDFLCTGTGAQWATAALDHGKTPEEAIEYAIKRDRQSGPPVRTLKFPRRAKE